MSSEQVITALEAAVAASPSEPSLRMHLVSVLLEAERPEDALPHIDHLLEVHPGDSEILRAAVDVHRSVGDERVARSLEIAASALDSNGSADGSDDAFDDVASNEDPDSSPRRAAPVEGDDSAIAIPDTADELLDSWEDSEPLEEVDVGHLGVAGVTLADVGGLAHVKGQLERSFLGPMRNPEMAAAFGKAAGGGLLLWGPPGCGKTFLARATAGEMGANFYNVGLADVLDMWIGASERNLASIFDAARRNTPCVLFFDEIDALGQKRAHLRHSGALRGVVNQLLSELDGVSAQNDGVFVLAATNHPWDVDEALLRPGRFDRRLLVLPPDAPARESILSFHLRGRPVGNVDLERLVLETEGYSGADLSFIVETATENCLDESMRIGEVVPLTTANLEAALDSVKPTIGPWLETARNHVMYANRTGEYDELEAFLKEHDVRSRKRRR